MDHLKLFGRALKARALGALTVVALGAAGVASAQVNVGPATPQMVANALAESPGAWADEAIDIVVSRGLYIGYPDGTFGWRQDITRAEMAVVLARLIQAYGLDAFDPEAQAALRQAIVELDGELGGALEEIARLRDALAAANGRIDALEAADAELAARIDALEVADAELAARIDALGHDGDLEARVAALEDALAALRGYATLEDLAAVEAELDDALARLGDVEARLAAIEARPGGEVDTSGLWAAIDELRQAQTAVEGRISMLEMSVHSLHGTSAPVDLGGVEERLEAVNARVSALSADLGDVEARLDDVEERLADLEGRMDRVEDTLFPDRGGFYVSVAAMGSDPNKGVLGRVAVGHDSVLGNIGFRVNYEHSFGASPSSAGGAITYTTFHGRSDAYVGVGAGAAFEADTVFFGEMFVGVQYRLARHFAVFVEGRYRPYFDGSGEQYGGIGGGLQFRF